LIEAERAQNAVSLLCSVLGVTRACFYAWRTRGPSKHELRDRELSDEHGVRVSCKRVARLTRRL